MSICREFVQCAELDSPDHFGCRDLCSDCGLRVEYHTDCWRAIDSAPKDGTQIIAWEPGRWNGVRDGLVHQVGWVTSSHERLGGAWKSPGSILSVLAEYWMPIPKLPNGANK